METSLFPDARIFPEGWFTTPQRSAVQTNFVDLTGRLLPDAVRLAKVSEPKYDLRTCNSVRLSRPSVFQHTGEVLVRDQQEGRAQTLTEEVTEGPAVPLAQMDRRIRALNAGLRLSHAKVSVTGTATKKNTSSARSAVTFGKDWLIYCTSLRPDPADEQTWRRTFPDSYTTVVPIHRPTQFAQALGLGACEHIGASGDPGPVTGTFHGFKAYKVYRTSQIVLHGPVLYLDSPYRCIEEASPGWEKICSMIFVKSREYAAQREYRFAMLSVPADAGEVVDLPVSGMLRDSLLPAASLPDVNTTDPVKAVPDDRVADKPRETSRGYTYTRRRVRRESGNWSGAGPDSQRMREDVVEETVTSPEEIPEPFPEDFKPPEIILFEQVGTQVRFVHTVHREEELQRMRIETLRTNPAIVQDPAPDSLPHHLEVEPVDRWDELDELPADPRMVLELRFNPALPRPPWRHEAVGRCNRVDVQHALACTRSLAAAVDLLDGEDREHAAASAWYAAEFILDLVSWFGPVVKSVCVVRECVAVVELERAPLSDAVGWATFSGTGVYTLYVHRANVEEFVYPGDLSRAERMSSHTYIEALEKHGWRHRTLDARTVAVR